MTLYAKFTGATARQEAIYQPPWGPGFPVYVAEQTEVLEILASGCKGSSLKHCEFRALDNKGNLLASKQIDAV